MELKEAKLASWILFSNIVYPNPHIDLLQMQKKYIWLNYAMHNMHGQIRRFPSISSISVQNWEFSVKILPISINFCSNQRKSAWRTKMSGNPASSIRPFCRPVDRSQYRVSQNKVTNRKKSLPKSSAVGPNFPIEMTCECLILPSLSKKRQDTRGTG